MLFMLVDLRIRWLWLLIAFYSEHLRPFIILIGRRLRLLGLLIASHCVHLRLLIVLFGLVLLVS